MKNCKEIKQLLSAYADGELSDEEKKVIDQHIETCSECKKALNVQLELNAKLTTIANTHELPNDSGAIMSAIMCTAVRKSRRWLRPVLVTTPIVLVVAILTPILLPNFILTPEKVLAKASETILDVQSYRIIDQLYDPSTNGVFVQRYQAECEVASGRFHFKKEDLQKGYFHEQIGIGEHIYVRGDPSVISTVEEWQEFTPSAILTQEKLDMLLKIEVLPDESIDGVVCFHYRGIVDIEKFIKQQEAFWKRTFKGILSEESLKGFIDDVNKAWREAKVTWEFWVGEDDYIIRQWKESITDVTDHTDYNSMEIVKYYDFNVPISIEPPLDAEGNILAGWSIVE